MFAPFVLAAATSLATQFFDDFGGTWTCANGNSRSYWNVESPNGNAWTIVSWGRDKDHIGGRAYVGYLPQTNRYIYEDFHDDGSFSQLHAPPPAGHRYEWTGDYYAAGAAAVDPSADIVWQLTPKGTIERHFAQRLDGKLVDRGSDTCTKVP
jgi:hypothetical protein